MFIYFEWINGKLTPNKIHSLPNTEVETITSVELAPYVQSSYSYHSSFMFALMKMGNGCSEHREVIASVATVYQVDNTPLR